MKGIYRPPVDSPHKGQWRRALTFSLICARTKGWADNRDTIDLSRYCAHYDVTVMVNLVLYLGLFKCATNVHISRCVIHDANAIWKRLNQLYLAFKVTLYDIEKFTRRKWTYILETAIAFFAISFYPRPFGHCHRAHACVCVCVCVRACVRARVRVSVNFNVNFKFVRPHKSSPPR